MVEYALLVTMVAISMIVIMGTVGGAAGTIWQAIIDNFETNPMFSVPTTSTSGTPDTTTPGTPTTAPTSTITPGGPSLTPTETLVFTLTPSLTSTEAPTESPTATSTTMIETPVPTAGPVYVKVTSVVVKRQIKAIRVEISVNETVDLRVYDTQSNVTKDVTCKGNCSVSFDPLPGGGYISVTSSSGDKIIQKYNPE